jgi:hypothetical protein
VSNDEKNLVKIPSQLFLLSLLQSWLERENSGERQDEPNESSKADIRVLLADTACLVPLPCTDASPAFIISPEQVCITEDPGEPQSNPIDGIFPVFRRLDKS